MNIRERVAKQICAIADIDMEQINTLKEINLITDLELDSIKIVELIVVLENEFGIDISDDYLDLNILANFQQLVSLIEKLLEIKKRSNKTCV